MLYCVLRGVHCPVTRTQDYLLGLLQYKLGVATCALALRNYLTPDHLKKVKYGGAWDRLWDGSAHCLL